MPGCRELAGSSAGNDELRRDCTRIAAHRRWQRHARGLVLQQGQPSEPRDGVVGNHAFANCMLARTLVGRDYACPVVVRRAADRVVASVAVKRSGMHLAMHAL